MSIAFAVKCFHIKLAGCGKGHLDKISSHASMTTIGKASHSLLECQCVGTTVTYTVLKCAKKGKFQLASFFFFFLRRLLPEESDSDSLLDSCPSAQIVIWANRPNMCKQPGCIWHLQNGWKALEGRAALANSTYSSLGSVKKKQASTLLCTKNSPHKAPFVLIHRIQPNWILSSRWAVVISWMRIDRNRFSACEVQIMLLYQCQGLHVQYPMLSSCVRAYNSQST